MRGWLVPEAFAAASPEQQDGAVRWLSSQLCFPLTLAAFWHSLAMDSKSDPPVLCIAGARAEGDVPLRMWAELALLVSRSLTLQFVGPELEDRRQTSLTLNSSTSISCAPFRSSLLHESDLDPLCLNGEHTLPSAYVLFNPGLGTPAASDTWTRSISALMHARRPILLTCFDERDAALDSKWLDTLTSSTPISLSPLCELNPFASLIPPWSRENEFYQHWLGAPGERMGCNRDAATAAQLDATAENSRVNVNHFDTRPPSRPHACQWVGMLHLH